ncbi:MAG: hypothetical protein VYE68_02265 [Acidobacteriota bacterium]|nr:hypothetical protein [Acidobacteriota bacterium]
MAKTPRLTIVVTGRNDDYGGDFARRFIRAQTFNLEQLHRHAMPVELILVEWNPVTDRPLLADLLLEQLPASLSELTRGFVVDGRYQHALSLNPELQYLEFIAKNVGLRRATGRLVLATNTDIFFSRALVERLVSDTVHDERVYRANRIDLKLGIDESTIHHDLLENPANHVPRAPIVSPLYAGAAGDFILLDRHTMTRLRGFNEVYRLARIGVDHNFLVKAHSSGIPIEDVGAPVYHVSHMTSFQVAKHLAGPNETQRLWGRRDWHNHHVIYDNPDGWGLNEAPVTQIGDRIWRLGFDWNAVAPLVDLDRIVLPGMSTDRAEPT